MPSETAIWTLLPNGLDDSGQFLRLTVFVSPRLTTDAAPNQPDIQPLADFAVFSDWPAFAVGDYAIEFENHGTFAAHPDPDSAAPDSNTWKLVFPDGTPVGTHEFKNLKPRIVRSYPAALVADYVTATYKKIAELGPLGFPAATTGPIATLVADLRSVSEGGEWYQVIDGEIAKTAHPTDPTKPGRYVDQTNLGANAVPLAFAQAKRFYDRPFSRDPLGEDVEPPSPDPPKLDFHSIAAFCGDYPKLLRPLGLAIDLVVEAGLAPPQLGRVRVKVLHDIPLVDHQQTSTTPWTNYRLEEPLFIARPRRIDPLGDLEDGMVRLEDEGLFAVHQIDVDGSALKTVDFAGNAGRVIDHLTAKGRSMTPDELSVPALRSAGFAVTRLNRAESVVSAFDEADDRQTTVTGAGEADLFAEDVTRGYHVEVFDGNRWRSLCRRIGTYEVVTPGGVVPLDVPAEDDGFVKGSSTTEVPDLGAGSDDDLYLHEAVFGWEGWSLVASRPGQMIVGNEAGTPQLEQAKESPLVTSFEAAPGTLPRLRYGGKYRFRARAVDLAGNKVTDEAVHPDHVSPPDEYLRYDPVPSPAVLPRRPFSEGESLLRMVIRSTLGVSTEDYAALTRIVNLAGHTDPLLAYRPANDRHLAPPKTAQQMAEWHGMFDAAFGPGATQADRDKAFDVSARDAGSFIEASPGAFVFHPDPQVVPTDLTIHTQGDPLKPGEYVCQGAGLVDLPYLPDVFSRGLSLAGLPGTSVLKKYPWQGTWPDLEPIRIRIVEGTGAPKLTDRVLTVPLPKAELAVVRMSSYLHKNDLARMGVWRLQSGAIQQAEFTNATDGRHWMLTPPQTLVLVHAVEKPLTAPVLDVPPSGVQRKSGETFAVLAGTIDNHAKSTGRLDVEASWTEPIDDLASETAPTIIDGQAHVGDFLIERHEEAAAVGRDDKKPTATKPEQHELRHEFGDTKHRVVTYQVTATTRYREYFPPEITDDPKLITHTGPTKELIVPSSRRPDPPGLQYIVPTFTWDDGVSLFPGLSPLGSHAATPVRRGPSRRRSREAVLGRAGSPAEMISIEPTAWQHRSGGGLRIYLDRPWFSSGAGELLGVIIKRQPWLTWQIDENAGIAVSRAARLDAERFAETVFGDGHLPDPADGGEASFRLFRSLQARAAEAPDDDVSRVVRTEIGRSLVLTDSWLDQIFTLLFPADPGKYLTRWGQDPIWGSAAPSFGPAIHHFPLRTAVGYKVLLDEVPAHVTVVGHQPEFDPDRGLWYCDIQMDAGLSYTPFVKLALCRYQPHSIGGHHISRVVMADFTQLLPERTVTHRRSGDKLFVTLRGPGGYSHLAEHMVGGIGALTTSRLGASRYAEVQAELRQVGATTDLAWRPAGDAMRLEIHPSSSPASVVYWGNFDLPPVPAGQELRMAVREFDILPTDASQQDSALVDLHFTGGGFPGGLTSTVHPVKYRLVYATHLSP